MKIKLEQLSAQTARALTPIYFLTGDVPLLLSEARDIICRAARKEKYDEINKLTVLPGFDWQQLLEHAYTLSLFSDKTIIDLQLASATLTEAAKNALLSYAAKPPRDKILIIRSPKLTGQQTKAKWFTTLTAGATLVQVWPLDPAQFQHWLQGHLHQAGFVLDAPALALLSTCTEGNLLAAKQEIAKLRLQFDPGKLSFDQIAEGMADHAKFNVFLLTESVLQGDLARSCRILSNLHEEGVEPHLVLFALCQETRQLMHMLTPGQQDSNAIWAKRRAILTAGLKRHNRHSLNEVLQLASLTDRIIKGAQFGNAWHSLEDLITLMATGRKSPLCQHLLAS